MRTLLAWLVLCGIWSSTWMVIKVGLNDLPPLLFSGLRFVVAAVTLLGILVVRRAPLPARRDWPLIALTGVLTFGVNYGCLFWGEQHVASGLAAILQATIPGFGIVFAHHYLPDEPLTVRKSSGVLLGMVGVAVIFSNRLHSADPLALWGCAAIVLGALSVAFANVQIKARGGHLDPMTLAAGQMVAGMLPTLVLSGCVELPYAQVHWTGRAVMSVLYLALAGSATAFCLMYWLLRNTLVTRVMLISLITPVAAVYLGFAVLRETVPPQAIMGGVCVLFGVGLVLGPFRRVASINSEEVVEN